MGADITDGACHARFGWISAPQRLFISGTLDGLHQPVLEILHQYFTNHANCACAHKVARMPYSGVAGVVVRQCENELFLFDQSHHPLRLCQVEGHRLLSYHLDTMLPECPSNPLMQ